jgi:hypothetical protein
MASLKRRLGARVKTLFRHLVDVTLPGTGTVEQSYPLKGCRIGTGTKREAASVIVVLER